MEWSGPRHRKEGICAPSKGQLARSSVPKSKGTPDPWQPREAGARDRPVLRLGGGQVGSAGQGSAGHDAIEDDADECVGIVLIFHCQRSPTVPLEKNIL